MDVVVVESPAKAKTINKYLGSNYKVLASYGHVRDLPPKDGSVNPDKNFDMLWQVGEGSEKHLKAIVEVEETADIPHSNNFVWMSFQQILTLLQSSSVINIHTRSLIACFSFT